MIPPRRAPLAQPSTSNKKRRVTPLLIVVAFSAAPLGSAIMESTPTASAPSSGSRCNGASFRPTLYAILQCLPIVSGEPRSRAADYARCALALLSLVPRDCEAPR